MEEWGNHFFFSLNKNFHLLCVYVCVFVCVCVCVCVGAEPVNL